MKSLFLFISLICASIGTQAIEPAVTAPESYRPSTEAQCTEIDLRGERCPDGSNRLPGLRSQGMTNYCFAFATTDIISYASCRNYSALSSGIIANITDTGQTLKDPTNPVNLGGSPRNLLNTLRRPGSGPCLEAQFPSSPPSIMPQSKEEGADQRRVLDFLMGFYNRRTESNPLSCERQSLSNITFNDQTAAQNQTNLQLQRKLTEALETRHEPAGMHVYSNVVMENSEMSSERPANVGTDHYITIVGRKWINGHCHYLYRDQNPMRGSPWPRAEDHPNQAVSGQPSNNYFYIWVREENLLNNSDDVFYNTSR